MRIARMALVTACLLLPFRQASGAAPGLAWETAFDGHAVTGGGAYDVMNDVVPTEDGGVVAAGYSIPPLAGLDMEPFVVRLDAQGRELWRTHLRDGAGALYFEARRVHPTADHGFVLVCVGQEPVGTESPGVYYATTSFVAKLDAGGRLQWRRDFNEGIWDEIGDVAVLSDGTILGAGRVVGDGGQETQLVKLSPSGELLWTRRELPDGLWRVGRVAAAQDGGLFVAFDDIPYHTWVGRFAPDGSYLWSGEVKGLDTPVDGFDGFLGTLEGSVYVTEKAVHGLAATPQGGCVVTGGARLEFLSPQHYGTYHPFTATFDAQGAQTAVLAFPTDSTYVHAAERLSDGGLLAAESASSDDAPQYVRYDARGNKVWRTTPPTRFPVQYISAIRTTGDGKIVVAGAVEELGGSWMPLDGYVMKLNGGAGGTETPVRIDVRPGSQENVVNCRAQGLLNVALLSSRNFAATKIRIATITLEGAPVAPNGKGYHPVRKDVNGDGLVDLLLWFDIPSLGLTQKTTSVTLRGSASDGTPFAGSDSVRIVGAPTPTKK